jgi:hypothetical protein
MSRGTTPFTDMTRSPTISPTRYAAEERSIAAICGKESVVEFTPAGYR